MQSGRRMVLLRRATQKDAPELYLLRYAAYLPQYGAYGSPDCPCVQTEAAFREQVDEGKIYAVTLGGRLAGGLAIEARDDVTEIRELYVRPEFRRTGVAQVALLHAEARCPAARYRARVISGEGAAIALLRKMGYTALPTLERPRDRVTLLTMEKTAASMLTLSLEPLRREHLSEAVTWIQEDPDAELYRPLWSAGEGLTVSAFSKDFAFGKHYIGAPQMDYAIRAVEFDQVIGIASLMDLDWEARRCRLDHLLLAPRWRGVRLGSRALRELCRLAEEQYGFSSLRLTVLSENARAIACFLRCGFAEALRRQNVLRGGEGQPRTRILMLRSAEEGEKRPNPRKGGAEWS